MAKKTKEIVETEVIEPTDIALMKTPDDLRRGVKAVLMAYEKAVPAQDGERSPSEIWDQTWKVEDTNETVLLLMNQAMTLFQTCYDKFFSDQKKDEEYLRRLQKEALDSVDQAKLFCEERDRIELKKKSDQRNMREYMSEITKMAHEYRQCRTQAAYFFHITQFQQFYQLLIAILHQEIQQIDVLERISKKLGDASLKLFPVETKQDS